MIDMTAKLTPPTPLPTAVTFVTVLLGFGGDWAAFWRPRAMIVGSRESRGRGR